MKIYSESSLVYLNNLKNTDAKKLRIYLNQANTEFDFKFNYNLNAVKMFINKSNDLFNNIFEFHFGVYKNKLNSFVGLFSVMQIDYNKNECEIGYLIGKEYRKKEFGKNAISLLLYFIFEIIKIKKVYAIMYNKNNNISKKIIIRCKFKKVENNRYQSNNINKFNIDKKNNNQLNKKIETYVLFKKSFKQTKKILIE